MKLKRLVLFAVVSFSVIAMVGCNKDETNKIGIRGYVKEISIDGDTGVMLVEGKIEEDTLYDKANVTLDDETVVKKGDKELSLDDIKEGDLVEVDFYGEVAESYPVKGVGKEVRIIK